MFNMSQNSRTAIIKNIIHLREKHNLTREQLSLLLDLDNSYIGKLEGRKINISVEILDKIAEFFHIKTEMLFKNNVSLKSKIKQNVKNRIKNVRKRLGKNIMKRREKIGISQEEMSKNLGLSVSYIGRVENGSMNITLDKLTALADFFETEPHELLR